MEKTIDTKTPANYDKYSNTYFIDIFKTVCNIDTMFKSNIMIRNKYNFFLIMFFSVLDFINSVLGFVDSVLGFVDSVLGSSLRIDQVSTSPSGYFISMSNLEEFISIVF